MTNQMPDGRDMDSAVRGWLRDENEPSADRNRQIGRIMGRVDETKQRRRLWPLNPFGRRAMHSAGGTDGSAVVLRGSVGALAPIRVMTAVALAFLVTTALVWFAARPLAQPQMPGGWVVDPADKPLFERLVTLWVGEKTDLDTTLEVYAEDAVHDVLWLDDHESFSGNLEILDRMRQSEKIDRTTQQLIPLDPSADGAHRYLLASPARDGTACVIWIDDDRITRHDCIMPMSINDEPPTFPAVSSAAAEGRETLSTALLAALNHADNVPFGQVVSPEIIHHVLSENQVYTLEGISRYGSVLSYGGPVLLMNVDLPAPEGELRWANFTGVGGGSLCVFWARDDLIVRHDCVVPGSTSVRSDWAEPRQD